MIFTIPIYFYFCILYLNVYQFKTNKIEKIIIHYEKIFIGQSLVI